MHLHSSFRSESGPFGYGHGFVPEHAVKDIPMLLLMFLVIVRPRNGHVVPSQFPSCFGHHKEKNIKGWIIKYAPNVEIISFD